MRFDWGEGGRVVVYFDEDEKAKTRLSVQHELLPDSKAAKRWKPFWRERVAALKELLEA